MRRDGRKSATKRQRVRSGNKETETGTCSEGRAKIGTRRNTAWEKDDGGSVRISV